MGEIQNQVVTQHLQMNETEKKLLAAEEEKYGRKLVDIYIFSGFLTACWHFLRRGRNIRVTTDGCTAV